MTTEQMDAVDAMRTGIPLDPPVGGGKVGPGDYPAAKVHGMARGGFVDRTMTHPGGFVVGGGIPPRVPEERSYSFPPPVQQVHIDLVAFAEVQTRTEKRALILDLLEKIDAINVSLPGSLAWENKEKKGSDVMVEVRQIIKSAL